MNTKAMTYCLRCATLRTVRNCHQSGDELVIQLDACHHVILRTASLEWFVDGKDVAPSLADASPVPEVASRF
jgi:hypothetical protein